MFLGLDIFTTQPCLLFPYNTLLILLQDNTKRKIAFNLSWIFFSEKMIDLPGFFFHFVSSKKVPTLPIKNKWSLPDFIL